MYIRTFIILVIVFGLTALALLADTQAKPTSTIVDPRHPAGTIACRDAQIFKLHTLLVQVEHNPLAPSSYNEANEVVADILTTAEQLQVLCK